LYPLRRNQREKESTISPSSSTNTIDSIEFFYIIAPRIKSIKFHRNKFRRGILPWDEEVESLNRPRLQAVSFALQFADNSV
jgi:hypothetical protein